MIEIVREPKEWEVTYKLPKNVRQIGTINGYGIIYMTEEVHNMLRDETRTDSYTTFVLLGDEFYQEEKQYLFIKAAVPIQQISYGGGLPVFSEDVWDEIYRILRKNFHQLKMLGWAMDRKGMLETYSFELEHLCSRHFHGEHLVVMFLDTLNQEERLYLRHKGRFVRKEGYHVYEEKNSYMEEYLKQQVESHEEEITEEDKFSWGSSLNEQAKEHQYVIEHYRESMKEKEKKNKKRTKGIGSAVAAIMLLVLSGFFVKNYMDLQKLEKELDSADNEKAYEQALNVISESTAKEEKVTSNPYLEQGSYIVQEQENLVQICEKIYGNQEMLSALCQANGITDVNSICPGDQIVLPQPEIAPEAMGVQ